MVGRDEASVLRARMAVRTGIVVGGIIVDGVMVEFLMELLY